MKLLPISPDANGTIDGTLHYALLANMPLSESMADADAVVVPIAYHPNYVFNPALLTIKKLVVILDYLEFGWDATEKENVLGLKNLHQFGHLASEEWSKLDEWIRLSETRMITFKRELFQRNVSDSMLPAEFPCLRDIPPVQTREEFDARPIEVFNSWGLSNPARPRLHGCIFITSQDTGFHVVDSWDQDNRFEPRTWASIHSPWYNRKPMDLVDSWNVRSKISVSLPGAGVKCFRSSEAPRGSIMALREDNLVWSYPWVNGRNCIRLTEGLEIADLLDATKRTDLYDIYRASQETIAKYRSEPYVRDYMLPKIAERL